MRYDGVAQTWWSEAVTTVVTRSQYTDLTPFENCFKTKPPLHYLRVFGAPGYCHVDETKRTQFDVGSFCCMFLGYAKHTKGYKGFDLETRTVETSRTITHDEREVDSIQEGHMSKDTMNNTAAIPQECGASDDLHCEVYNSGVGMSEWENMHEEGDVETDKQMSEIGLEYASVNPWAGCHPPHTNHSQ